MTRLMAALAVGILALAACDSGDGGGGGSTEAFCGLAEDIQSLEDLGEGVTPGDFSSLTDQFDELATVLDRAVDAAPDEIRDDVEFVATEVGTLLEDMREPLEALAEDPEAAAQNPELFSQLAEAGPTEEEQAEIEEASERIETFVEEECGIDTDADSDSGDSGTSEDEGDGEEGDPFGG